MIPKPFLPPLFFCLPGDMSCTPDRCPHSYVKFTSMSTCQEIKGAQRSLWRKKDGRTEHGDVESMLLSSEPQIRCQWSRWQMLLPPKARGGECHEHFILHISSLWPVSLVSLFQLKEGNKSVESGKLKQLLRPRQWPGCLLYHKGDERIIYCRLKIL